jgi:hypothetical protein
VSEETATVVSLDDFKAARANGGWRAVQVRCVACSHLMVAVAPAGSSLPSCSRCNGAVARELTATRPDGTEDPQIEHRRYLIGLLEDTLAAVVAGRIDGAFLVVHQSETHPDGCGWEASFSGNLDPVHQLGALDLARAHVIRKAGL